MKYINPLGAASFFKREVARQLPHVPTLKMNKGQPDHILNVTCDPLCLVSWKYRLR